MSTSKNKLDAYARTLTNRIAELEAQLAAVTTAQPAPAVARPLDAAPVTDDGSEGTSFVDRHRDEIAVLAEKAGIAPMLAWPFARSVLNLANSGVLVLTEAISDGEVKATCAIAGVNYLPPDADPDGYPGGFDMTSLDDMRKIIAASRAPVAQPAPAVVKPAYWLTENGDLFSRAEFAAMYAPGRKLTPLYMRPAPQPQQIAEPASPWVSVAERLPPAHTDVMIYPRPTDYCCEAAVNTNGCWSYSEYESNWGQHRVPCRVTHWMPLPATPTKEPS